MAVDVPVAEEPAPPKRDRLRLAAFVGALASAVVVAAFFLPWIYVPPEARPRLRDAIDQELRKFQDTNPAAMHGYEMALGALEKDGHLDGIGLFVFSRAARELNEAILDAGSPSGIRPAPSDLDRELQTRRAFTLASIVLVALPIASLLLVVHFVAHLFRRARSPTLILLTLVGMVGGALTISWYVFANAIQFTAPGSEGGAVATVKVLTGDGLRATLVASVTQTCCGLFGVTARNWWRVYAGSLAMLGALAFAAWAYVVKGIGL